MEIRATAKARNEQAWLSIVNKLIQGLKALINHISAGTLAPDPEASKVPKFLIIRK